MVEVRPDWGWVILVWLGILRFSIQFPFKTPPLPPPPPFNFNIQISLLASSLSLDLNDLHDVFKH